jgi:hypothetical protein
MGLADAVSSVQGALSRSRRPRRCLAGRRGSRRLSGLAAIQACAIFDGIPRSERILTVIVLVIAMVQIGLSRPRSDPTPGRPRRQAEDAPASAGTPEQ